MKKRIASLLLILALCFYAAANGGVCRRERAKQQNFNHNSR